MPSSSHKAMTRGEERLLEGGKVGSKGERWPDRGPGGRRRGVQERLAGALAHEGRRAVPRVR
eukprot:4957099-Pyramimonas_sp.AAC.1